MMATVQISGCKCQCVGLSFVVDVLPTTLLFRCYAHDLRDPWVSTKRVSRCRNPCRNHCINPTSAGGVVRLCGARGLEPALVAAAVGRGGHRTPILPVVISGGAPAQKHHTSSSSSSSVSSGLAAASLPEGAHAAILKHSPRPCYYRIDRERLFCREAWQPVAAEAAAARARSNGGSGRGKIVLVVEADSLSSDAPQTLMSSPVKSAAAVGARGGGGSSGGGLGEHQAVWGLAMLRRALEERRERESGRVASVLLAERRLVDVEGSSTVSIDARAALLLSVLSWAQQCAAEALAEGLDVPASSESESGTPSRGDKTAAYPAETPAAPVVPEGDAGDSPAAKQLAEGQATVASTMPSADADARTDDDADAGTDADGDDTAVGGGSKGDGTARGEAAEAIDAPTPPPASTATRVLGVLENMGRGVRVAVAPFGQLRSTVGRSLSAVTCWVEKSRRRASVPGKGASTSRVLYFDTDDDESFQWLAAQVSSRAGGPSSMDACWEFWGFGDGIFYSRVPAIVVEFWV